MSLKMNKTTLNVISRAVKSSDMVFNINQTWKELHDDYGIGMKVSRSAKIELTSADKASLIRIAINHFHINPLNYDPDMFDDMDRHEMIGLTPHEKMANEKIRRNRVAIKSLLGYPLLVNGDEIVFSKPSPNIDYDINEIESVGHNVIMVIENLECFYLSHMLQIDYGYLHKQKWNPLVVYRGDLVYSAKNVNRLIELTNLPVLVMPDLDPAGLKLAQSTPNVIGYVAPSFDDFESMLQNPLVYNSSHDLYLKQTAISCTALNESVCGVITNFWQIIQKYRVGLVQEQWINGDIKLMIHEANKLGVIH